MTDSLGARRDDGDAPDCRGGAPSSDDSTDHRGMRNILIVDDNELICSLLCAMLSNERTRVYCATSGAKALAALQQRTFGLCFLDLRLPDVRALELMLEIRERCAATKIIMMTGGDPDDEAICMIRKHAVLLLVKPFDLFLLEELVEEIFEKDIHTYWEYGAMVSTLSGEKRRHDRQPFTSSDNYILQLIESAGNVGGDSFADTIDISQNGLGIRTNIPLEPGRIVCLCKNRENIRGIVRWAVAERMGDRYRAGIQFLPEAALA